MRFNLHSIDRFLSNAENLKDFCALVVVQELLALLAGLSLLKERELGEKVHRWKYLALLPSQLLPFVVMYLTVVGFNRLVRYEFDTLLWWSAGGFVLVSALSCEVWGLVHSTERRRVSAALAGSWMLVLLAVFLPAAAGGELSQGGGAAGSEPVRDFAIHERAPRRSGNSPGISRIWCFCAAFERTCSAQLGPCALRETDFRFFADV